MKKIAFTLSLALLAAAVLPAAGATAAKSKSVPYKGRTSGGHKIVFDVNKNVVWWLSTGIPVTCVPIQGNVTTPSTGVDVFDGTKWGFRLNGKVQKFTETRKPYGYYNEVDMNHDVTVRRTGPNRIAGKLRLQYSFLIPRYPIGTFNIYSCLGTVKFKAKRVKS